MIFINQIEYPLCAIPALIMCYLNSGTGVYGNCFKFLHKLQVAFISISPSQIYPIPDRFCCCASFIK